MKLITFELRSSFGFFKKPDINDSIYLTYNMLHKPALLGILGAILGECGHYQYDQLPDYYRKLKNIKIGIEPIGEGQENGIFEKTIVKYNNATGHANEGTLNVIEQILINPEYRIYLYVKDSEEYLSELKSKLKNQEAVFIPYMGKNDFPCWWENYDEIDAHNVTADYFKIDTIFAKPEGTKLDDLKKLMAFGLFAGMKANPERKFSQFERLPVGFNKTLKQYSEPEEFVFTNIEFSREKFQCSENFVQLERGNHVVYLF
ncbi:MAG: type I-B CRISPR-associated protein Cas5b [Desulforegulaceae bacterium]|nr:type I-B CRISPR-associated protein Cas5b [Desulforegulaceae bacterium]